MRLPGGPARRRGIVGTMAALASAVVLLAACSPFASLNELFVSSEDYRLHRGFAYGPEKRQALDVYVPEEAAMPARVVVFFYGGAWRGGSRTYYRFLGQALSRKGLIVVIPDYRVYPEVRFPEFVEDGARALRWVRDHIAGLGGDPDDIWLMGHSAGAHTAALLVTDAHYLLAAGVPRASVRGFVGLAGPYAFDPLKYPISRPAFSGLSTPAPAQPITHVSGAEPPMLLLHGADDDTVWPINSRVFAARVNEAGGHADLVEYAGVGHTGIILSLSEFFRGSVPVFADTVRFLVAPDRPVPHGGRLF